MFPIPDEQEKQQLAFLGSRPEWAVLRTVAEERMERHFRKLASEFATKDARPDYAELQWHRGFFAGMKFLLDNPTVEARALERLVAEHNKEATVA